MLDRARPSYAIILNKLRCTSNRQEIHNVDPLLCFFFASFVQQVNSIEPIFFNVLLTIIIIESNLFADYPQFIDYCDNFSICFI